MNSAVTETSSRNRRPAPSGTPAAMHLAGWMLLAFLLAGCREDVYRGEPPSEECFPVQGRVFFDGKPCKNATVRLHPLDPSRVTKSAVKLSGKERPAQAISPRGDVDETGEFRLTTFETYDGAPEGKYAVTISWKDPENRGGDDSNRFPELLPTRYQNPATSGLLVEITPEDEIVLKDFQLVP